jgi:hypothetical protein
MTERHYAHFAPSHVAKTIRASFPTLGIVKPTKVATLIPTSKVRAARDSTR